MEEYSVIGKRVTRVDARVKVTGEATYTGDIVLPRTLCGKLLRSPYPHAKILSIDTSKAERLPGVKAVITGKEIGKKYYLPSVMMEADPKLDTTPLAVDKVRHIGDAVAAVAAIDERVATEALRLIKVEYEQLPAVFDFLEAMKDGAPQIHDHSKNNIMTEIHWTYGDIEKGFRESDYTREDTFRLAGRHALYMETQIALSNYDATGKLTCWTSTQVPHLVQRELARLLGITMGNIRVIKPTIGGAFCQKLDIEPHQILSAMLSIKTGCPVKIELSREETFLACGGLSPTLLTFKTGVKKDGTIVSRYVRHIVEAGGYQCVAPANTYHGGICLQQVYRQSYLKYDGYTVYTNTPPRGTERGGGGPNVHLTYECHLDMIADDMGLDQVAIRLKNGLKPGEETLNGIKVTTSGLVECIEKVVEESNWKKRDVLKSTKNRGIGIACEGMSAGGMMPEPYDACEAFIKMQEDGTVTILTGGVENGAGQETAMSMIAAEVLGVGLEKIKITASDTEITPLDLGTFGSRGLQNHGNAVYLAAMDARKQLFATAAEMLGVKEEALGAKEGRVFVKENPEKGLSIPEVVRAGLFFQKGVGVLGKGHYNHPCEPVDMAAGKGNFSAHYSYGAQVAEVEVDTETGHVKVLSFVGAHDCGRCLNPVGVEAQMQAQMFMMGVGKGLTEQIVLKDGTIMNPNFLDDSMATSVEMPVMKTIIVEEPDPHGPLGAKEVGEGPCFPPSAAISNAIYDAVGVRMKEFPITAEKVLEALENKKKNTNKK